VRRRCRSVEDALESADHHHRFGLLARVAVRIRAVEPEHRFLEGLPGGGLARSQKGADQRNVERRFLLGADVPRCVRVVGVSRHVGQRPAVPLACRDGRTARDVGEPLDDELEVVSVAVAANAERAEKFTCG
jgi:hypothetical protein